MRQVRITVSRGVFLGRGLLPPGEDVAPTIVIQAWAVSPPPADHLERGLHLIASAVRRDPESPLAALKTTSRAPTTSYARIEARRAGADDALFLTIDGFISEGDVGERLPRPRRRARDAGPRLRDPARHDPRRGSWAGGHASGCAPIEGWLTTRDLAEADEAFLCSSVAGILPVSRGSRGRRSASGAPGSVDRPRARRPRGVHPGRRRAVTRAELVGPDPPARRRGRPAGRPSRPCAALQVWLQLSDDLLAAAWGSMDRYHLAWLMVGKSKTIVRGRPMTADEEAAYVREVAEAKTRRCG